MTTPRPTIERYLPPDAVHAFAQAVLVGIGSFCSGLLVAASVPNAEINWLVLVATAGSATCLALGGSYVGGNRNARRASAASGDAGAGTRGPS